MKTKLLLSALLLLSPFSFLLSPCTAQVPMGFNYQAIARDGSGGILANTALPVKITIQTSTGTVIYEELFSSVITNQFGLISLVVGTGTWQSGSAATFSAIDWKAQNLYLKTTIQYPGTTWTTMGTSQIWGVPYSLVAKDVAGPISKLGITGTTDVMDEALFEVKNKKGNTVFAVYNEGIRAYVGDGSAKGVKGGFSVGGYDATKSGTVYDIFVLSTDSARFYLDSKPKTTKGIRGGFSVGGYDMTKGVAQNYLQVSKDSVRIYVDSNPATKGVKGGFSVGGYDMTKGGTAISNYLNVETNATGIINPSQNRILWYPVKNAFLTGRILIEMADSVGENSFASGYESKAEGQYSQALGYKAIARGDYSTAIGKNAVTNKINSFAFGENAKAVNEESYAFGRGAIAIGYRSFAFGSAGVDTTGVPTDFASALGDYSFAIGQGSQSIGKGSFAIGLANTALGKYSTALGYHTSSGEFATSLGFQTNASGYSSIAGGFFSSATNYFSIALGYYCTASGDGSIALGNNAQATYTGSIAIGFGTKSTACSAAIGYGTTASKDGSTAMGINTKATGYGSTSIGYGTIASGDGNVAMGANSKASGYGSTAIGFNTNASGDYSCATGMYTNARGSASVAMGFITNANGDYSTAIGDETMASKYGSVAMGMLTVAKGSVSTAMGGSNVASGTFSVVMGFQSIAKPFASLVSGQYNDTTCSLGGPGNWILTDPLFILGNGTANNDRSNALTVLKNGCVGLQSVINPTYALQLPNSATITIGSGRAYAWTTYSDSRLKENQIPLNYGLREVLELSPKQYVHHSSVDQTTWPKENIPRTIGLIAQEVYNIIPEAVDVPESSTTGLWGLNYDKLIPVLVKAIQEQQTQIESDRSEIQALKEKNEQIESQQKEIEELKTLVNSLITNQTAQVNK